MKDDFYFSNENAENSPPDSFQKTNDTNINVSQEKSDDFQSTKNSVDNADNFINIQNSDDKAKNEYNQTNFQPNYYGYQQSYQPFFNGQLQNSDQIRLYYEKKAVKRTANFIGLGLILFFAFNFVISYIFEMLSGNKAVVEFLNDPAILLELNIVLTVLGFGLSAIFILRSQNAKPSALLSYGPPKRELLLPSVMTAVGFCFVSNVAVSLLQTKFQDILPFAYQDVEMPEGILGYIISVLSVAIAPALIEEFLFRGVIMGSLLKFGKAFAIFTSALIFALIHGNLVQIPFAFLVGLAIGLVVIETNSIWTGVIVHFINNFISVNLDYLSICVEENLLGVINFVLMAVLITVGIIGFYILSLKNKNLLVYKKNPLISSSAQKFGWFCSSAAIIIFFVITFFEILAVQLTV